MIRRDAKLPDGSRMWTLISQVDHARLSGELAARWIRPNAPPIIATDQDPAPLQAIRQEVLAAIVHHDDGWAAWEASPSIDPVAGRPPSFMEMPTDESLAIWDDSISRAQEIGPLAAWMVAGHFSYLLRHSDSAAEDIGRRWLAEMDASRCQWLVEWTEPDRKWHTVQRAEEALGWLQLFDQFSLWLCCFLPTIDEPVDPAFASASTEMSGGREFRVQAAPGSETVITLDPWPYYEEPWDIAVSGHRVPVRRYETTEELLRARQPLTLLWRLAPG